MTLALYIVYIFLSLIEWVVIFDIILSWMPLIGIRFRPKFIASIMDPLYALVHRFIPTVIGALDFSSVIILITLNVLTNIIVAMDPMVIGYIMR